MDASDTDPLDLEPMASDPPGGSGSGSGAVLGRNRKPFKLKWACDSCRRKKIQCDGTRPACLECSSRHVACVYTPGRRHLRRIQEQAQVVSATRAAAATGEALRLFERRLHTLEQQLAALSLLEGQGSTPGDAAAVAAMAQARPPTQRQLVSMQQQLAGLRGELAALHALQHPPPNPPHRDPAVPESWTNAESQAPAAGSMKPLIEIHADIAAAVRVDSQATQLHTTAPAPPLAIGLPGVPGDMQTAFMPDLDSVMFRTVFQHINSAVPLVDIDNPVIQYADPVFLNCMRAAASRYIKSPRRGVPLFREGEEYYQKAVELLGPSLFGTPSYTTIIGLMLLAITAASAGRGATGNIGIQTAINLARTMGLDDELRDKIIRSHAEIQLRRRLWWSLVSVDRLDSRRNGVPCCIAKADPSLTPYPDDIGWTPTKASSPLPSSTASPPATSVGSPNADGSVTSSAASPPLSAAAHFHILTDILSRIQDMCARERELVSGEIAAGPEAIDALARERLALHAELMAWHARVPEWIRFVYKDYGTQRTPTCPRLWRDSAMLAMFHSNRIELHLPSIARMIEFGLYGLALADPMLLVCVESATAIDQIVQVFLERNPYGYFVPPDFVDYVIPLAKMLLILSVVRPVGLDLRAVDEMFERLVLFISNFSLLWHVAQPRLDFVRKLRRSWSPIQ
ncbi:Transcriptional activator [Polyrhizophydium stewartii]|uniref:Transcriptional activator n=1 Tax=Polyrhizophydium stewartii TaxID=2732419 RepID=A0ABR4N580_9FUNG